MMPVVRVASLALFVLAEAAGCGCPGPEEIRVEDLSTTFRDPLLSEVRAGEDADMARCEAACMILADQADLAPDRITYCNAEGDLWDEPWDARNTEVEVSCGAEISEPGFCTGRRPQGHVEAELEVVSPGTWFAVHAHLERASVAAFAELAVRQAQRRALAELPGRVRANARATPPALGWPDPRRAGTMARRFADACEAAMQA